MCCWIITHPISKLSLKKDETIQLYYFTSQNKDCFCIIISLWSSGVKMLCVKFTDEGYNEIKRFENHTSCYVVSTIKIYLNSKPITSYSPVNFNYQVTCELFITCLHDITPFILPDMELCVMTRYRGRKCRSSM